MKGFLNLFKQSYREMTGKGAVRCLAVTGMLCALSMAIEGFTITLPFTKINFAFLALAAIGMLFGPVVAFFAGGICDVLGFFIHPDGGFIPVYVFIAMLQGLIYGIVLYHKGYFSNDLQNPTRGRRLTEFGLRMVIARLLDVVIINLMLNTYFNMHYGFIPAQAFGEAIAARAVKNLLELVLDIPLMFIVLPTIMVVYGKASKGRASGEKAA